ncbi:MAG: cytochrome c, partial [Planctomycetota bacterium]
HRLAAAFIRKPGAARLELFWEASHFRREPLPYDHLFHLPGQETAKLAHDALIERGRFLAEEHSCTRCHRPDDQDTPARGLLWRQGPDLSQIGSRAYAGWIDRWLQAPHKLRPGAVMPTMFPEGDAGRVERHAVTRYLVSLGGPHSSGMRRAANASMPASAVPLATARSWTRAQTRRANRVRALSPRLESFPWNRWRTRPRRRNWPPTSPARWRSIRAGACPACN